mmetsp:Transcript_10992/g.25627  ORF Transcript_10992/g.25627 Transcript_10992/m.25627 type:complete len:339 (-) Transcript_10992:300-1316(-)
MGTPKRKPRALPSPQANNFKKSLWGSYFLRARLLSLSMPRVLSVSSSPSFVRLLFSRNRVRFSMRIGPARTAYTPALGGDRTPFGIAMVQQSPAAKTKGWLRLWKLSFTLIQPFSEIARPKRRSEVTSSRWQSAPVAHIQCVKSICSPDCNSSEFRSTRPTSALFRIAIPRSSSRCNSASLFAGVSSGNSLSTELRMVTRTFVAPTTVFHRPSTPIDNSMPAAPPPTTTTFAVLPLPLPFSFLSSSVAASTFRTSSEIGLVGIEWCRAPGTLFKPRLVEPISIEMASKGISSCSPLFAAFVVTTSFLVRSIPVTRSFTNRIPAHSESDLRSTSVSSGE